MSINASSTKETDALLAHNVSHAKKRRTLATSADRVMTAETKRDLYVLLALTFLGNICYSICLPSIYLYLKEIHASDMFLGFVVSAYSAAAFIAAPIFGMWADVRNTKEVMACGLLLNIVGNVVYSLVFHWRNVWYILVARAIVGIFAGTGAVVNAHISLTTSQEDRAKWITLNSIANTFGFIMGPACSLGLSKMNFTVFDTITVNQYTSPGWCSAVAGMAAFVVLIFGFKDKVEHRKDLQESLTGVMLPYDKVGFVMCVASNCGIVLCLAVFETVATPFTKNLYNYDAFDNGLLFTGSGVVSIVAFIVVMVALYKCHIGDRIVLLVSLVCMGAGFALLLRHPHLAQWRMWVGVGVISWGYSPAAAMVVSVFSKVIPQSTQGLKMGVFNSAGSFARIAGPVISNAMLVKVGANSVWALMIGAMVLLSVANVAFYRRMDACEEGDNYAGEDSEGEVCDEVDDDVHVPWETPV